MEFAPTAKSKITWHNVVVHQTSWETLLWRVPKRQPNATDLANATKSATVRNRVDPLRIVRVERPVLPENAETNVHPRYLAREVSCAPEALASLGVAPTTTAPPPKCAETKSVKTCVKIHIVAARTPCVKPPTEGRCVCAPTDTKATPKLSANLTNADWIRIANPTNAVARKGLARTRVWKIELAG